MPQFVGMLNDSGQEVPWVTQTVIDVSDFFVNHGFKLFGAILVSVISIIKYKQTKNGKPVWDKFTMNIPIFGTIIIKGNLASFTRTLATLLNSGVPIIDALQICIETIDNSVISIDKTE